ncbi:hypothetical protein SEA_AGEOFDAPAGE_66 [Mycobacterium phage Ageofdapage]|nr:hypothetical protein SEA_AGEOFDAPAGE_66 [Mycobacterium phage Ageofdapage]
MSSNPNVEAVAAAVNAQAIGIPVTLADTSRALWQQQLAVAEATERVQERQMRLLHAQRDVINAQLDEVTRKRDDATRQVLQAQAALDELAEPLAVGKLDPTKPEHRGRVWRGQAGEIWQWYDGEHEGPAFLWTYEHPAAGVRPTGTSVGGPFTEVRG